jgi:predicted neutral ceramidase superfamily lipid hydrolase
MILQPAKYDVIYVGNYAEDTIITSTETRYVNGRTVNYTAQAGARLENWVIL